LTGGHASDGRSEAPSGFWSIQALILETGIGLYSGLRT
jgi:hypothetical protein